MTTVEARKPLSDTKEPGFETRDIPPRYIIYAAIVLFVGAGLSVAVVAGLLGILAGRHPIDHLTSVETEALPKPGPRLEVSPRDDGAAIVASARAKLQGYAWTDQSASRAHIPIERAMALTAAQGWPDDHPTGGKP